MRMPLSKVKEPAERVDTGSLSAFAGLQLPQLADRRSLPWARERLIPPVTAIQARERPCACSLALARLPTARLVAWRPVVERLACWSARHRKTAVAAWLAFMAAAFIVGQFATAPECSSTTRVRRAAASRYSPTSA